MDKNMENQMDTLVIEVTFKRDIGVILCGYTGM